MKNKIKQNILYLIFGKGSILLINFFTIIIATRYLGVAGFGIFASILALANIISKFIDFGFSPIVFREITKTENDYNLLYSAISIRLVAVIIVTIIYNLIAVLLKINSLEIVITDILLLNIIFSSRFVNIRDLLETPFKSKLEANIITKLSVLDSFLTLIIILFVYFFNAGILAFVLAYTLANLPGFIILLNILKNTKEFRFKFSFENSKYLIKSAFPLYGYTLFLVLYLQADVLLLKILSSEYAAGIYSSANRITMPLSILPQAVVTTLFPIIVKNIEANKSIIIIESLTKKILLIAAVIPSILVTFKSTEIVILLFGNNYSEAGFPLSILFWSYVFMFYNYFSVELQTALNKQHNNFFFGIIISSTMIILIYVLAQKYEYDGVAVAKLIAATLGTIYFLTINKVNIYLIFPFILWLISGLLVSYLISDVNLFLFIPIILVVYYISAIFIKIFSKDELKVLQDSIGKYKWLEKFAR